MKFKNIFNNDCFVEFKPCLHTKDILTMSEHTFITTNINDDISSFVKELKKFEKINNPSYGHSLHIRYGVFITILLDKQYPCNEQLVTFCHEFASKFNNLPFYAVYCKHGNGNYIKFYFCERYFYPEGKEFDKVCNRDMYRNKKTGRACLSTDPDAYLYRSKGTIYGKKISKFSKKEEIFKYPTKHYFNVSMGMIKQYVVELLQKIMKSIIAKDESIKKIRIKDKTFAQKNKARVWNKAIKHIETKYNNAVYGLKYVDCFDESEQKEMKKLLQKYIKFIEDQYCVYHKRYKIYISCKVRSYQRVKDMAELFVMKFDEDLCKLYDKLVPHFD